MRNKHLRKDKEFKELVNSNIGKIILKIFY